MNLSFVQQTLFSSKQTSLLIYAGFLCICLSLPTATWGQSTLTGDHLRLSMSGSSSVSTTVQLSSHLSLGRTSLFLNKINNTKLIFLQESNPSLRVSRWYLPDYARDNPANWAPLCHLEADIEKQLPIGIWINWEESDRANSKLPATANVRFRLLSF